MNIQPIVSFQRLTVEYRASPRHTTLFMHTAHYQDVEAIQRLFRMLASGAVKQANLREISGVRLVYLHALYLYVVTESAPRRAIDIGRADSRLEVHWRMTPDLWNLCQALLEGSDPERPWHQYLNDEPSENPVIVFGYKETTD